MGMFYDFNVTSECHVQTICNSTISDFQFNGTEIMFNVSGENGTAGFCRICIPTALMNDTFTVYVDGVNTANYTAAEDLDRTGKLRKLKYKKRVNFTIDEDLFRKFRNHCEEKDLKMSKIVEELIKNYLGR